MINPKNLVLLILVIIVLEEIICKFDVILTVHRC